MIGVDIRLKAEDMLERIMVMHGVLSHMQKQSYSVKLKL